VTFVVVAIAALIPAGRRAIAVGAQPAPTIPTAPEAVDGEARPEAATPAS